MFCTIALTTSLVILVLPGVERCSMLARGASRMIFRLGGAWPRVHGLENLPAEPCVVAANHESFADGILLCALLPPRFRLVIKREMRPILLAGRMLSRIGAVFVEREEGKERIADVRTMLRGRALRTIAGNFPGGNLSSAARTAALPFGRLCRCRRRRAAGRSRGDSRLPRPAAVGFLAVHAFKNRSTLSGSDQGNGKRIPFPAGPSSSRRNAGWP